MTGIRMHNTQWIGSGRRDRKSAVLLGASVAVSSAMLGMPGGLPAASAAPCPDVEVVFARGTNEPPGVGDTGQVFVDGLRSRLGERSVGVYASDGLEGEAVDFAVRHLDANWR